MPELFRASHSVLVAADVATKLALMRVIELEVARSAFDRSAPPMAPDSPARPPLPRLVHPSRVPRRGVGTPQGRAATLHAIAHIEFNAIHLALEASLRFPNMPDAYHRDWIGVALEESRHFRLLAETLQRRGYQYGSFDAHDGLWELARRTSGDVLARMAIVPRIVEARGLDVTPGLRDRFRQAGDTEAVEILGIILAEEIGHVACGNRWFRHECALRGLDPESTSAEIAQRYAAPRPRAPFNLEARRASGFTEAELTHLAQLAQVTDSPAKP